MTPPQAPPGPGGAGEPLAELLAVMRRLRVDCAWKRDQTHRSLARFLLEEAHEAVEAMDTGSVDDLREELGDVLLQVVFHAVVAEEAGDFTLDDVAAGITAKMVRRNPHVFAPDGGEAPTDPAAVNELWESVKAQEKHRTSLTEGIPAALPALLAADKVLDRLARAGTPPDPPTYVLVPSPLLGPATWRPVQTWLLGAGHDAVVVDLGEAERTPAAVVDAVVAAAAGREVVLVLHSNAGLYGPHLATLLRVRSTVYVDAALPTTTGATVLAPPDLAAFLAGLADEDGLLPPWTHWWGETPGLFPDVASRAGVEAEQPRLPLSYVAATVPVPDGWERAPSAYVAFGRTYEPEIALAERAGWPVTVLDGGHLHPLHDPAGVGAVVVRAAGTGAVAEVLGDRLLALVGRARADGVDPEQALRDAVRRLLDAHGQA